MIRFITWLEFFFHFFVLDFSYWLLANHLDSLLLWLHNKDVAPNLVAKLDVSSLHSEVGGVASFISWCLALDGHFTYSVSLDFITKLNWLGTDIISSGLEELNISWP